MRLNGRHAIVTGGGTGIGAAIARALAAEGATLTLIGRRRERLEQVASDITGAVVAQADVTERAQIEAAFALGREAHGPVSILINNAGAAESAPFERLPAEIWRRMLAINLDGVFHGCQAAMPDLLADPAGRIVTVASSAGLKGYAYTSAYAAAKHGAVGLTRALAAEYAKTSLTINAVCPGFTDTEFANDSIDEIIRKSGRTREDVLKAFAKFNPQQRMIAPEEVAGAVVWLCLPDSQSMNGQAIAIAGGEIT